MPRSQRDLLVERTRLERARAECVDQTRLENIYQIGRVRNPVCSKLLEWCRSVPTLCASGGQANTSCAGAELCYPQRYSRELARKRSQAALLAAQEDTATACRCSQIEALAAPGSQAHARREYAFDRLDSGNRKHEKGVHWANSVDAEARATAAADAVSESSTTSWDTRSTRSMHTLFTPMNNSRPAAPCLRDYQTAFRQRRAAAKAHTGKGGHSGSTTHPSTSCFDDDAPCQASTAGSPDRALPLGISASGAACDEAPLLPWKRVRWSATVQVFTI